MSEFRSMYAQRAPETETGEPASGLVRRGKGLGAVGYGRGDMGRLKAAGLVCLTLLGCSGGGVTMSKAVSRSEPTVADNARSADASPKFLEAVAMYAAGRYERTATLLELHLLRHPGHYHGRVLLARALMYSGRPGEAVTVLRAAGSEAAAGLSAAGPAQAAAGPTSSGTPAAGPAAAAAGPDAQRLLAEALLLDGRFAEAEPVLRTALERNSEDPRLLVLLARVYRNAGRGEQAASLYRQALIYRSELGIAARELSQVYAARGAVDAAEHWSMRAAELLPEALQLPEGLRSGAQ